LIKFLSLDEILALLESALYRPRTGYYADIAEMATALFQSLLMNHPFVDGNKRVAFFATDVFLRLNGWRLKVDTKEAHAFIVGCLESNASNYANLLIWIRCAMRRIGEDT
jgi:death on curing protein